MGDDSLESHKDLWHPVKSAVNASLCDRVTLEGNAKSGNHKRKRNHKVTVIKCFVSGMGVQ